MLSDKAIYETSLIVTGEKPPETVIQLVKVLLTLTDKEQLAVIQLFKTMLHKDM